MDTNKQLAKIVDIGAIALSYSIMWGPVIYFSEIQASPWAVFHAVKAFGTSWPLWFQVAALTALAVGLLSLGFNPFREPSNDYGGAHWANKNEMKKLGLLEGKGLILGQIGRWIFKKYVRMDDPLSVLLYAPPGSGKTAGIIIPSLLSCGNSAIVHDPKGELIAKTGPRRSAFSKIINFAPGEKESLRWNPLSKKELPEDWEDKQVVVDRISQSLIVGKSKKEGDDYWTKEARSIFVFWALFLIYKNSETSFPEILEAALAGEPQEQIAIALDENPNLPKRLMIEGNGLLAKADKEFGGVMGTFKSCMNIFLDARVAKNVSGSDFSLWDLRSERTTIYLTVKNTDQSRLKPLLSLFFEVATLTALDHEPSEDEYPITMFLDEFVRLARMQEVLEMPAIGRSYKLNAIYVCQSFSQIVDIYGQAGADQLKNTCSYHVFFAQNEFKVAQDISNSIGKLTRKKRNYSTQRGSFFRSNSESDEGVQLIFPQEIMSLKVGRIIICRQNAFETPVDCRSAFWFKDAGMISLVQKGAKNFKPKENPEPQAEVEIEEQITPTAKADKPELETKETLKNEPEEVTQVEAQIAKQIEPETQEEAASGEIKLVSEQSQALEADLQNILKCSKCGRTAHEAAQQGVTCRIMQGDGSLCDGTFNLLEKAA